MKKDIINLYVEKYVEGTLLLDFITEKDFLYFKYRGEEPKNITIASYTPSMLLIHNVNIKEIHEGDIIAIPKCFLIEIGYMERQSKCEKIGVAIEFDSSDLFERWFNEGIIFKNNKYRKYAVQKLDSNWNVNSPCSLECLSNNFEIRVLDVGQGSTNFIIDKDSLTIFDFGTSIYSNEKTRLDIVKRQENISQQRRISLIISHWDIDHYNLLTVVDDTFFRNLCCSFIPNEVITLTAKQVAKRIFKNCSYVCAVSSAIRGKHTVGIHKINSTKRYDLYIGEKSSDKNKSGLALVVYSKNDATILAADHSNHQVWNCIYSDMSSRDISGVLNIVVPHHGGLCGKISLKAISEIPGIAAISVGKNNYKHPNQHTIDTYKKLGFDVERTDWERKDICIKMN